MADGYRYNQGGDQYGNTTAPRGEEMRDQTLDRTSFGGSARRYDQNGQLIPGTGSADNIAQGYRDAGSRLGSRAAYQNDYGLSHQDRTGQQDATGLMRSAAMGMAPSRAEIMGRGMIDDSINAAQATGASVRGGPMQAASAMHEAQIGAAAQRQAGMQNLAAMRADEMARARGDYMGATTATRGQDLQETFGQQQNELAQRQMNQQGQLSYDQLAQDTYARQQQAAMQQAAIDSSDYQAQKAQNTHSQDRETGLISGIAGGVTGAAGSILDKISDPRAKQDMGSLGPSPLSYAAGPQAAPGYAASRAGQPGYMFGGAPDVSSGYEAQAPDAPGTADWNRYGAPGADDAAATMGAPGTPDAQASGVDWTQGGAAGAAAADGGSTGGDALRAFGKGFGSSVYNPGFKVSDPLAKFGTNPMNSPMSGPAPASFGGKTGPGGMDVMGELRANANVGTQFVADPTGGAMKISDARAKQAAFDEGRQAAAAEIREGHDYARAAAADRASREAVERRGDSGPRAPYVTGPRATGADSITANLEKAGWTPPERALQEAPPAQMMDGIGPGKTFRYRPGVPGEDPSQQHFGTTTQDLRKTPMGASMVKPHPSGFDGIDVSEAVGPTLASLGNLNQRLRLVEKKKGDRT